MICIGASCAAAPLIALEHHFQRGRSMHAVDILTSNQQILGPRFSLMAIPSVPKGSSFPRLLSLFYFIFCRAYVVGEYSGQFEAVRPGCSVYWTRVCAPLPRICLGVRLVRKPFGEAFGSGGQGVQLESERYCPLRAHCAPTARPLRAYCALTPLDGGHPVHHGVREWCTSCHFWGRSHRSGCAKQEEPPASDWRARLPGSFGSDPTTYSKRCRPR